ncbi:MAG: hypothetical protein A2921_04455 [Candidatus Magasanikbacteria bacterium RIFCSPLOWO2_01_FULL_43_20b]|uniref:HAD family hydrolase n=1 Tax=Candidatus Magasanikbacteria bacterium RIFCSPLOWO2_12_FULL_43_12 TaxID=1798692 RepID=A0A1F6MRR8_9BACT|nr:MAG: hypothetical protein A3C74_02700 [Candidatus Magasanikbacteria bacterium RIFCSPHIGHO2_02_FULL_44_13]OGH72581.1 MAG: hypothetical protein A3I93_01465 [Candidatus Magasanikbacteria bacterium RIFCSPLOWO2_02_FULL_43_22]OGH73320.1 MAG: hypothetical protein A2921_04455 [Candidatus Magasanikbacteria bacterium RIFCSPLOWO2_01_FULL_43_20b]OGH74327.1 MAG: hypothetical protein A3G00_02645 [Candidatus Magasanikbacteria bacterium RIFCSPLOWO2_12_FULL_43_12]
MIFDKIKIKAVIFDWGGVCCREAEPFASKELQKRLGLAPEEIIKEVVEVYDDFYRGKYSGEVFWRKVMSHFKLAEDSSINPLSLAQAYLDSYELWPEVMDIALRLRGAYKVGLLSDLSPVMRDHIRSKYDLNNFFPVQVFSCDEGINLQKKDGVEIFKIALNKMDAVAEAALFIDNSKNKIKVAEMAGLKTLLFEDKDKFLDDIKVLL